MTSKRPLASSLEATKVQHWVVTDRYIDHGGMDPTWSWETPELMLGRFGELEAGLVVDPNPPEPSMAAYSLSDLRPGDRFLLLSCPCDDDGDEGFTAYATLRCASAKRDDFDLKFERPMARFKPPVSLEAVLKVSTARGLGLETMFKETWPELVNLAHSVEGDAPNDNLSLRRWQLITSLHAR